MSDPNRFEDGPYVLSGGFRQFLKSLAEKDGFLHGVHTKTTVPPPVRELWKWTLIKPGVLALEPTQIKILHDDDCPGFIAEWQCRPILPTRSIDLRDLKRVCETYAQQIREIGLIP
jgi:hypothetical protein